MKTGNRTAWTWLAVIVLAMATPSVAQNAAAIIGAGSDIRVLREGAEIPREGGLVSGDDVLTGGSSFAEIEVGAGVLLSVGSDTRMRLLSAGPIPAIRLDQGTVRVRTRFQAVGVASPAGSFRLTGLPGEARFESLGGRLVVQVLSGDLTAESVDLQALVIRAPGQRPSRTYRTGFTEGFKQSERSAGAGGWLPNVYLGYPGLSQPVLSTGSGPQESPGGEEAPPQPESGAVPPADPPSVPDPAPEP